MGTWELNLNDNRNTYLFKEDNTFERTLSLESQLQLKLEQEQKEVFLLAPMDIYRRGGGGGGSLLQKGADHSGGKP